MQSEKYKVIFIHIPKTGGTSIEKVFNPGIGSSHMKMCDYENIDKYYKFTVVRNPWERIWSMYHYFKSGGNKDSFNQSIREGMPETFEKFCLEYIEPKKCFFGLSWLDPQIDFIKVNGKIEIDCVIKYENLLGEFEQIREKYGLEPLGHHRRNPSKPDSSKMNDLCKKIIYEAYTEDFVSFEY